MRLQREKSYLHPEGLKLLFAQVVPWLWLHHLLLPQCKLDREIDGMNIWKLQWYEHIYQIWYTNTQIVQDFKATFLNLIQTQCQTHLAISVLGMTMTLAEGGTQRELSRAPMSEVWVKRWPHLTLSIHKVLLSLICPSLSKYGCWESMGVHHLQGLQNKKTGKV